MENSHGKAPHACSSCKKQKRRCDKTLPECSLCRRVRRPCDYSENQPATSDSIAALQNRINELEVRLSQSTNGESPHSTSSSNISRNSHSAQVIATNPFERFPSTFFLDHEIFNEARMTVPRPTLSIPDEIYNILGSVDDLRGIADRYFSTVHLWLAIVSKKRIQLALNAAEIEMHSDCALLLATMRMISDDRVKSRSSADSHIYRVVKNQYSCLEASAMMSPQLLQIAVLIAVYEIGHAIYPAAYLSVGRCVTLGKAIGLDNRHHAPQMFRRYGAWAEMEEIRRTWWAVLLLDRYVHISSKGHSLGTDEPSRTEILPADDENFDNGDMVSSEPLYVASPIVGRAGPFTRTLQAAHLVGKTVNAMNDYFHESEARFANLIQLHKTLTAFHKVVKDDFSRSPNAYSTALALTNSALLHVSDPFCCSTSLNTGTHTAEEVEMQNMCIASISTTAWDVVSWFHRMRPIMLSDPASISPLTGDALYLGIVSFSWMVYEKTSPDVIAAYKSLREAMTLFKGRWASGGEYLDAVDKGKEVLYNNSPLL